jgi:hypothetical protein
MAPRAPAEQPPKSTRWPGTPPRPLFWASVSKAAWMMRCPRKLKPKETSAAPMSPLQASLWGVAK